MIKPYYTDKLLFFTMFINLYYVATTTKSLCKSLCHDVFRKVYKVYTYSLFQPLSSNFHLNIFHFYSNIIEMETSFNCSVLDDETLNSLNEFVVNFYKKNNEIFTKL